MLSPTQRASIFGSPTVQRHFGVSYNAARSPQLGGLAYAYAPDGALVQGSLTQVFTNFTGDNKSYYMGPSGLLVASATNTPRIEYTIGGTLLGLLVEGTQTNIAIQSNDWTNAAWVATTMTTAKTAIGPDGVSNSATTLTAAGANSLSLQTIVSASATRAFSVWMKRRTGTGTIQLCVDGTTFTTKAITSSWARYQITQAAVTNPICGVKIVTSGDAIDVWGAQVEAGGYATSVIPTTTVAVTRADELCFRTAGAELSQTAGTTITVFDINAVVSAANRVIHSIEDGTSNERYTHLANTSGNAILFSSDGGVNQFNLTSVALMSAGVVNKFASAYALNDAAISLNAATPVTTSSGTLPTPTSFYLGSRGGAAQCLMGHILSFDYWPERKANAFLQNATA